MALDAIVASTRERVAARRLERPIATLFEGLAPSDRSFNLALAAGAPACILEVKPASPTRGVLRGIANMGEVVRSYGRHATAISVLTEPQHFGGSFELLRHVRAQVRQPVLCKDFIVDPYQVVEARHHGADAVLLMLSVLDDAAYETCAAMAKRLRMGILTEVHNLAEMRRARAFGARVIGINNRNLRTLQVDVARTRELAPLAPEEAILISESGIKERRTLESLRPIVDGFLIGTAAVGAADPDRAVRELVYGRTKVCGLTRNEDAQAAAAAGATHGGVVFHPLSRRVVSLDQAQQVFEGVPLSRVAIFVNEDPRRIANLAVVLKLAAVQLHGDETAADILSLRRHLPAECEIWKGIRVAGGLPASNDVGADLLLFDTFSPTAAGGTGLRFDWNLLPPLVGRLRFAVAGGLTPDNVGDAAALGAELLDVSSGVERSPGVKDRVLIERFLQARPGRRRQAPAPSAVPVTVERVA